MVRLLVSVVDAEEAAAALAGGAHIVDVKNPAEGALGAPAPAVVRAIRRALPGRVALSVALGDLPDLPGTAALAAVGAASLGADYVKVGLRGPGDAEAAGRLLAAVAAALRDLAPGVRLIACAYADGPRVGAVDPLDVPAAAAAAGCAGAMVDTLHKGAGGLFAHMTDARARAFVEACRRHGLTSALAGSLTPADLPRVAALGPDIAGVRGAACTGGDRLGGRIDPGRVRALVSALAGVVSGAGGTVSGVRR
ncbi:(5-formylfuran-3-yl)methyl phosphate synthase [Caldinitratiruptor microaerophilus]|uniref:(5-formylfuran-3-yl)methyl phosphate synthase n=1 Tax=Caldinitratiruptor microaerophilus TaxID=671077 RepID=A0AA35CNB9_9FIRM|nr:(5-formylfuran-3-yl)methyl phosphate synthase [Caldinitratiruptor microaerophilus]BDG60460.1 hypothetical protein caldi_15500 [Caldinitratiruptor microaerophilus]